MKLASGPSSGSVNLDTDSYKTFLDSMQLGGSLPLNSSFINSSNNSSLTSSFNSANSASLANNLSNTILNQTPLSSLQHTPILGSPGTASLNSSITGPISSSVLQAALTDDNDDNNPFDVAENRDYMKQQQDTMEINQLIINVTKHIVFVVL